MMASLHASYPLYGFDRHMGYATAEHLAAIDRYGPCPLHRRSFSPVRQPCLPGTS
jgi:ribonuclease HII